MARVVKIQRKGGVVVQGCDVYIGRAMYQGGWQLPKSKWANKFKAGSPGITDAQSAVLAYWKWIHEPEQAQLLSEVHELKGKCIGCWCVAKGHEACHGRVLAYLADGVMHPTLNFINEEKQTTARKPSRLRVVEDTSNIPSTSMEEKKVSSIPPLSGAEMPQVKQ